MIKNLVTDKESSRRRVERGEWGCEPQSTRHVEIGVPHEGETVKLVKPLIQAVSGIDNEF